MCMIHVGWGSVWRNPGRKNSNIQIVFLWIYLIKNLHLLFCTFFQISIYYGLHGNKPWPLTLYLQLTLTPSPIWTWFMLMFLSSLGFNTYPPTKITHNNQYYTNSYNFKATSSRWMCIPIPQAFITQQDHFSYHHSSSNLSLTTLPFCQPKTRQARFHHNQEIWCHLGRLSPQNIDLTGCRERQTWLIFRDPKTRLNDRHARRKQAQHFYHENNSIFSFVCQSILNNHSFGGIV